MKAVTTEQMRELDRRTIEAGVPGEALMERAGLGVARAARRLAADLGLPAPLRAVAVAGKGNNGGDAFVAARDLAARGWVVDVLLAADEKELKGDALTHFRRLSGAGVAWRSVAPGTWHAELARLASDPCLLLDGVLGTGLEGAARGAAAEAIAALNATAAARPVVAIDVPSGLNSDTGETQGEAVRADLTVTLGLPKRGLLLPAAIEYTGAVEVVDIGIPAALSDPLPDELRLITPADLPSLPRRRPRSAHKGTYGHVLLIGGAPGFAGAIALAARAALRSGAGLVTVLTPRGIAALVAGMAPEAMVHAGNETDTGALAADCLTAWGRDLNHFDAVLIGPGLTVHRQTQLLAERVLAGSRVPLVMDADALNVFAHRVFFLKRATCPVIITPHPGELGRLMDCTPAQVQADRFRAAQTAAAATDQTVVLKGAGTLVARQGEPLWVNLTGNPGMATGGTGDVLSGLLAGLAAQKLAPAEAARAAVYLHGLAGDIAARRLSEPALTAGDLIETLPAAFARIHESR